MNEISKAAKVAKVGDGFQEGIEYGPLNNEMQLQKVAELVEDAKTHVRARWSYLLLMHFFFKGRCGAP